MIVFMKNCNCTQAPSIFMTIYSGKSIESHSNIKHSKFRTVLLLREAKVMGMKKSS